MKYSQLYIGPSFLECKPLPEELSVFQSYLIDEGAKYLFNKWYSKGVNGISKRSDLPPYEFHKLLPQIVIEEFDPSSKQSVLKLVGEFYRDLYPAHSWSLNLPYYEKIQQTEVVEDWTKSDYANYYEHSPTVHFFDLRSVGKEYVRLGELCLPVLKNEKLVQVIGYSWKVSRR